MIALRCKENEDITLSVSLAATPNSHQEKQFFRANYLPDQTIARGCGQRTKKRKLAGAKGLIRQTPDPTKISLAQIAHFAKYIMKCNGLFCHTNEEIMDGYREFRCCFRVALRRCSW